MNKRFFYLLTFALITTILAISFSSAYYGNSYTYTKQVTNSPWGSNVYISKQAPGYSYEYQSMKNYGPKYNSLNNYWANGPYSNWNHYQYPVYSDTYVRKVQNTGYYDYYYQPTYNNRLGYYNHRY